MRRASRTGIEGVFDGPQPSRVFLRELSESMRAEPKQPISAMEKEMSIENFASAPEADAIYREACIDRVIGYFDATRDWRSVQYAIYLLHERGYAVQELSRANSSPLLKADQERIIESVVELLDTYRDWTVISRAIPLLEQESKRQRQQSTNYARMLNELGIDITKLKKERLAAG